MIFPHKQKGIFMKALIVLTLLISSSVSATTICSYRFNNNLAVTLDLKGSIEWDNKNTCARNEDGTYMCTEIYPGRFKVLFRKYDHDFRISSIATSDDLGNRFNRKSQLAHFVRNARFTTSDMSFTWKNKTYQMVCRDSE